jgi:hypothetical protein
MGLRVIGEYVIPIGVLILVLVLEIWDPFIVDVAKLLIKRTKRVID